METDSQYSAEAALRDVAETRTRTQSVTDIRWPIGYSLPVAVCLPLASLGFVVPGWWGYLFPVAAIAIAVAVMSYLAVVMDRRGVQPRMFDDLRKHPVTIAILIASGLAYFVSMPLTDINSWNPWTVPAVGLACGMLWAALMVTVGYRQSRGGDPDPEPGTAR